MKITILSVFYPFRGGIAQFSNAIFKEFSQKNKVLAINFKRQYPDFLFPGKTQFVDVKDFIEEIETEKIIDSINPLTYISAKNKINEFHTELLIVNYWMTFFGFCKGFVAKKSESKIKIALIHNLIPHEKKFYDNFVNRYFLKQFDGFVVMSDVVKEDLLSYNNKSKFIKLEHPNYEHFGEKISKESAIQILVNKGIQIDVSKKTLLFFGLIREYKGLDILLSALSILDDSFQLIIAGECYGSFEKYQKQIETFNLNDKIFLQNNFIPDEDVSLYFSVSDLCILPYKSATQSGITAVANHFEVPIIASNVGGLAESVIDLETGLIVNNPIGEEFAKKINTYFEENLEKYFKENISKKNKEQSWEFFCEKIIEFSKTLSN
jgi:glycosyltransferase involved in cell wall biosynthesis